MNKQIEQMEQTKQNQQNTITESDNFLNGILQDEQIDVKTKNFLGLCAF